MNVVSVLDKVWWSTSEAALFDLGYWAHVYDTHGNLRWPNARHPRPKEVAQASRTAYRIFNIVKERVNAVRDPAIDLFLQGADNDAR